MTEERATCRSCGAEILWAITVTGKPAPFDAEPSPVGTAKIVDLGDGKLRVASLSIEEVDAARVRGDELRISHFATCPDAKRWRGRRR